MTQVYSRGDPEFIIPGSPNHTAMITASKVASILNVSRWESAYSLWHRMRGDLAEEPAKDIYSTGTAFEMALAELWRIEHPGWRISRGEVQFVTNELGFPAMATIDRRASRGRSRKILECKIARDLSDWGDPDLSGDLPLDYVTQVTFQMMVSGFRSADVLLMGPWFEHTTYHVDYDQIVADWIARECRKFWDSLRTGKEPELDDSVSTYAAVKQLHPDIDGTEIEVPADLIEKIRELRAALDTLKAKQQGQRNQLLDLMGTAQTGCVDGEPAARRQPHPTAGVVLVVR